MRENAAKTDDGLPKQKKKLGTIVGAAFIMATSCIGPAFLTQSATFTGEFKASFGFVILVTVILALCAQLNIWQVICVSNLRGQDVANKILPGLGYALAGLIAVGGLIFNIGNVGGTGLGIQTIFDINPTVTYILSGAIGIMVFLFKNAQAVVDKLVKGLGALIIIVCAVVIVVVKPPFAQALKETVLPSVKLSLMFPAMLTILGGTVGGYIPFSGAHRLIDGNISGPQNLKEIRQGAVMGIGIAGLVRVLVFLAVLGVVSAGYTLDPDNPAADAFLQGAGILGYKFFGLVLWAAGLSSVVGAAYTSISFLKTLNRFVAAHENMCTVAFIALSTIVMCVLGKPATLLVVVGALNGLILPITLGVCLIACRRKTIMGTEYRHPTWLLVSGIVVVIIAAYVGISSLSSLGALFQG